MLADFQYQKIGAHRYPNWGWGLRQLGRGLDFKNPNTPKYRKPQMSLTYQAACRYQIWAVPKRR